MFRVVVVLVVVAEALVLSALSFTLPVLAVLILTPIVPLTVVLAVVLRRELDSPARMLRRLSPEAITGYRTQGRSAESPEALSRSIRERAAEIRRCLTELPADEMRVEMCALGYRACANDMITLTHLTNEALSTAHFVQRLKLRRSRKTAIDALAEAREALPPEALRASRQEQQ